MRGHAKGRVVLPSRPEGKRRLAAPLLTFILLVPGLAGCLTEEYDPRQGSLQSATDVDSDFVHLVNVTDDDANGTERPDDPAPDPRLNLSARWNKGDTWYYESNVTDWMKVTVLGIREFDGEPHYGLMMEMGKIGNPASVTTLSHVSTDFVIRNVTLDDGFLEYDPGNPGPRFLPRYGTYEYNESGYQRVLGKDAAWKRNVRVLVTETWPLYPVSVPAGTFFASHFTTYTNQIQQGKSERFIVNERWYAPDLRSDIMLKTSTNTEDSKWFMLVYANVGGVEHGAMPERDWSRD